MRFDTGTIITIVAVLLFYMRLIVIQRQRIKKAQHQYAAVKAKNSKSKKNNSKDPEIRYSRLGIQIINWWVVAAAIILITFGAVIAATQFLGPTYSTLWWIPVVVGIAIFAFDIR